ncbi:hypothetical protein V3C99_010928 [Haemonchus contortus]
MFFRCMFMLWLLSLPDVSIQGKRPSVCDTTMKERESEDFSPCIKFNWELKDCSKLKIERGYVSRSKMGLNVCQAKDGGWLECTCEEHSLCIALALKKLRVLSRVFGDTCEPEIRNELDQKKKEWSDENGDEKKQWSDGDSEESAADSAIENNDTEETDPEDHVNADQDTSSVDDNPPDGPEGNVADSPSPITKPPNSSTSAKIDIVFYSMLGSMFHATLL